MQYRLIVSVFLMVLCINSHCLALTAPQDVNVSGTGEKTAGVFTFYSSTELSVTWNPIPGENPDHYIVAASESIGNTRVTVRTVSAGTTLRRLKAGTSYSVTVTACDDEACGQSATSDPIHAITDTEYWQLQGTGNSTDGLIRIVSDGNARLSATRIGPDAGTGNASRIQLYYGPLRSADRTAALTTAITGENPHADIPNSYLSFQSHAENTGLFSPETASDLVKLLATGQGVPLSADIGEKIRLFFEAEGADGKTRILWIDSTDGYMGRDFNTGASGICALTSDYEEGGGCRPTVAIHVETDPVHPNRGIRNARQFKVGYPTLDDWRWNGAPGTFMVFTTDRVTGCSPFMMNHGYAVWDGSAWQVQYEDSGCPRLFRSAQAAFPMHIGGNRYKMYYSDPSITFGRLDTPMPFLGPKKLIYADGAASGSDTAVNFEDWESQNDARDIVFLWPNGQQLDEQAEGYIDDYHFLCPTGSLDLQVMYLTITDGTSLPFASAAVLLNPGEPADQAPPVLLITANGSAAPVTTDQHQPVSIAVQIDAGDMTGRTADWWVVAASPAGYHSFVADSGWVPGLNLTYQGPLFSLNNPVILQNTRLEPGSHTYYFGVDLVPNGWVDIADLYYRSVSIHVIQAPDPGSSATIRGLGHRKIVNTAHEQ